METFTKQELIYIARALRLEARGNEEKAHDPKYGTAQHIWSESSQGLRELAAKADRMAAKL